MRRGKVAIGVQLPSGLPCVSAGRCNADVVQRVRRQRTSLVRMWSGPWTVETWVSDDESWTSNLAERIAQHAARVLAARRKRRR